MREQDEPLRLSMWDYGGQDNFYVLHHLYMSRFCVYLVMFNMQWLLGSVWERNECLEFLRLT